MQRVRLCHRVRYQAPDSRVLRPAVGSGMLWPVLPTTGHCAADSAMRGVRWRSGREDVWAVCHRCGVPQVHVHPKEGGPCGPAWLCEGVCTPSMRRCTAPSSLRQRRPAFGSGQGHAATSEHCAHLLVPIGVAEDTVSHSPQSWQVCGRWEAKDQGSRRGS